MDDFFELFVLPVIGALIVIGLILAFSAAGDSIDKQNDQKHRDTDKRYELCLKSNRDWVDGNCVTAVK